MNSMNLSRDEHIHQKRNTFISERHILKREHTSISERTHSSVTVHITQHLENTFVLFKKKISRSSICLHCICNPLQHAAQGQSFALYKPVSRACSVVEGEANHFIHCGTTVSGQSLCCSNWSEKANSVNSGRRFQT